MSFRKSFRMPDNVDKVSRDVDREIALHIELRAREFESLGMTQEDALEAARKAFGDRESIEREVASIRTSAVREKLRRDCQFTTRWPQSAVQAAAVRARGAVPGASDDIGTRTST